MGVPPLSTWSRAEGCAEKALSMEAGRFKGRSALGGDSEPPVIRGAYCSGRILSGSSSATPAAVLYKTGGVKTSTGHCSRADKTKLALVRGHPLQVVPGSSPAIPAAAL